MGDGGGGRGGADAASSLEGASGRASLRSCPLARLRGLPRKTLHLHVAAARLSKPEARVRGGRRAHVFPAGREQLRTSTIRTRQRAAPATTPKPRVHGGTWSSGTGVLRRPRSTRPRQPPEVAMNPRPRNSCRPPRPEPGQPPRALKVPPLPAPPPWSQRSGPGAPPT